MNIEDIIRGIPSDMKDGEILTRKYSATGEVLEEKRTQTTWKPNAADLDLVLVGCSCGNQYDTPRDTLMYLNHERSFCGQCGSSGKMSILADPSPNVKGDDNQNGKATAA